jgi:hypothetical protein
MSSRSRALIVVAGVMTAVYFVAPPSAAMEVLRVLAPAIAVGAVLIGVAGFEPPRKLPWWSIAGSMGMLAVADLVWSSPK